MKDFTIRLTKNAITLIQEDGIKTNFHNILHAVIRSCKHENINIGEDGTKHLWVEELNGSLILNKERTVGITWRANRIAGEEVRRDRFSEKFTIISRNLEQRKGFYNVMFKNEGSRIRVEIDKQLHGYMSLSETSDKAPFAWSTALGRIYSDNITPQWFMQVNDSCTYHGSRLTITNHNGDNIGTARTNEDWLHRELTGRSTMTN